MKTRELEKFLADAGLYESHEESIVREEVLGRLDQLVKIWVKSISRAKGLNEQLVHEANAKIFTFGSYRLGVHGPGADIDTLCVGPRHAERDDDFFGELQRMLSEIPEKATDELSVPSSTGIGSISGVQRKPVIRLNLTSMAKATGTSN
ncbi:hypothetical protein POM88_003874 [Heracleum sosnowskyi]|uniref:Poly(A) polymerase nucleotidyltransferase domain-containing protein n=1 Tax=Heracleum sosnowskyi TaxID=360622 RepID=A0AAD8NC22_9APIA|nr:hypothetical protein POM88_003874 [Heracleum sosnowskyi]